MVVKREADELGVDYAHGEMVSTALPEAELNVLETGHF